MMFNHVLTARFQWLAMVGKRSPADREANNRAGHRLALSAGAVASDFAVDPTPSNLAARSWRGREGKMATS